MHLALKARQARMRRDVEEMHRQVRRFSRTMEKIRASAPAAKGNNVSQEQPGAKGEPIERRA